MNSNATTSNYFESNLLDNDHYIDGRRINTIEPELELEPATLDIKDDENLIHSNLTIYRYKFSDQFMDELFRFAKIHEHDDRKTFKEYWKTWTEENEDIVDIEFRRLNELGYEGDIYDKMFKSARYYFRKKDMQKKPPTNRRIYIGLQKKLLESMDDHIKQNMDLKPSDSFEQFCRENVSLLKEEIVQLCQSHITDPEDIKYKFKKAFKNRYFLLMNKTN